MDATESPQTECIGHGDLAPWNVVFDRDRVVGVIDWDTARPMSRVWDLSYAAYHFLPLHPIEQLPDWGWDSPPDIRGRMRLFIEAYGAPLCASELVSAAAVRLEGMAVHIEQEIARANPLYEVHRVEGHASGYRAAASQLTDRLDLGEFEGIGL
ncbi:phosphotransferase [Luteococcus sp. OSA5]|uniref:phosphotransferase n=1 Tax=Luteococcus sp. OSA5 TaxID=3401630 RepID=UPI003B432671